MDLEFVEPNPQRVLEAFRQGCFDELEIIGQVDGKDFFELCFQKRILATLAESMPKARKKEEMPGGSFSPPICRSSSTARRPI